ncbi:sensor histidine kinase [Sulfitobacter sp. R18_1]|uniref:sensor histidine kinase n=1 Tax=Sulfitobacter sp. R18_1 TaxID=2821104 RepID=UPI001ADC4C31|nr:sensor histidine kinase [Sulfitobacter sp. R18_1]MBO9429428.1 sensor histidine kinase [Sulfitobacter sp. R18_1]
MTSMSLRSRLFMLILPPLLLLSIVLGFWRFEVAQRTSETLFDRSLLAAALAISRDVAISGGDALSPSTRDFLSDAGGGELFYHVTGPGGIYITGYAYPPVSGARASEDRLNYTMSEYRGEPVRVLRMRESTTIGNLTGDTIVTVWQRDSDRNAFAAALARRAAALIASLMAALAFVVWFGVKIGLRPLNDLQDAIQHRSPDDLRDIRRAVPAEVFGIVATLNRLFGQVRQSIEDHQVFISNAAHQLRNPASALLSLAEVLPEVSDPQERRLRERELIAAARKSARLANQLLSLERLRYDETSTFDALELNAVAAELCSDFAPTILSRDIGFGFEPYPGPLPVNGDSVLLGEAITNLLENALSHGGAGLSAIRVSTTYEAGYALLTVQDDGIGIPEGGTQAAFQRFGQLSEGEGSGLGLAIVQDVLRRHGGDVELLPQERGLIVRLKVPLVSPVAKP